jgi:hypothetical protein
MLFAAADEHQLLSMPCRPPWASHPSAIIRALTTLRRLAIHHSYFLLPYL